MARLILILSWVIVSNVWSQDCIWLQSGSQSLEYSELLNEKINIYEISENEWILLDVFTFQEIQRIKLYLKQFYPLYTLEELKADPILKDVIHKIRCFFFIGDQNTRIIPIKGRLLLGQNYYRSSIGSRDWNYQKAAHGFGTFTWKEKYRLGRQRASFGQGLHFGQHYWFSHPFYSDIGIRFRDDISSSNSGTVGKYFDGFSFHQRGYKLILGMEDSYASSRFGLFRKTWLIKKQSFGTAISSKGGSVDYLIRESNFWLAGEFFFNLEGRAYTMAGHFKWGERFFSEHHFYSRSNAFHQSGFSEDGWLDFRKMRTAIHKLSYSWNRNEIMFFHQEGRAEEDSAEDGLQIVSRNQRGYFLLQARRTMNKTSLKCRSRYYMEDFYLQWEQSFIINDSRTSESRGWMMGYNHYGFQINFGEFYAIIPAKGEPIYYTGYLAPGKRLFGGYHSSQRHLWLRASYQLAGFKIWAYFLRKNEQNSFEITGQFDFYTLLPKRPQKPLKKAIFAG